MGKATFFTIFLAILSFLLVPSVQAGSEHNVSGWAWSENIGWISFNCTNLNTCNSVNYGVNIDSAGIFSGYAWSENIGWISFNQNDLTNCPQAPCEVRENLSNGEVSGWARALSYGGGWDGWIKLGGGGAQNNNNSSYGVSINKSNGEFSGYAWSDMVIGWISFNCKNQNVCQTSNYKVIKGITVLNRAPTASNPNESKNHCAWGSTPQVASGLTITLNWTYSDPDGDSQSAYEIWLDDDSNFSGPKFNHLVENSSANSYALDLSQDDNHDWLSNLAWHTTYYWKVRVKDNKGNWSDWSGIDSFTTPRHASPYVNFSWNPKSPSVNEIVQFTDLSDVYGGADSWFWTFQDGNPATSNLQNPKIKFTSTGSKGVTLQVTDGDGYSCTGSKTVNLALPFPEWKEIPPF